MIKIKEYPNGTSLIVQREKSSKYIAFTLWIKVGSQDENKNEYGVAHFLEHIFFKSTKSMQSSDILKKLEGLGASINASTSLEHTQYYFCCLTENFEACLKIFSEMFYNGRFDKDEIDKERLVVLEEIKRSEDNSQRIAYTNAYLSMYHGLPFGHKNIGYEEVIKNITVEEIKAFKERTYSPEKIFISICGDLKFKTVDLLISKYFKTSSKQKKKSIETKYEPIKIKPKQKYIIQDKDDKQVNLYVTIKTNGYLDENRDTMNIFSKVLGNGMSSRLFLELREKLGLAYSTYSGLDLMQNCGMLMLYIGTSPEKVKSAIRGMKSILKNLAENGISEEELQKAKNKSKSNLYFNDDNKLGTCMRNASTYARRKKIQSLKQRIKEIESVSLEQVNEFAKQIFDEKNFVVSAVGKNFTLDDIVF